MIFSPFEDRNDKRKDIIIKMKRIFAFFAAAMLICGVICLSGCSAESLYSEGNGGLQVVATTFIPFDLARRVGGESVTLTILQDSGADLHNYTPTSATLMALSRADVFLYIGGESDEKWVPDAIRASENHSLDAVCLMDAIEEPLHAALSCDWDQHEHEEEGHKGHEGHEHHGDEHIWTSLRNASAMVTAICEAFCKADPANEAIYRENAAAYRTELENLDASYTYCVENAARRSLVVADRFPFVYLFHDYKIDYIAAFSGCSTEVNASFETQVTLIEAVREMGLPYVITTEGGQKEPAEAVAGETGCGILQLDSLQSVKRSDIENGVTYYDIMRQNLSVLKEALS